MIILKRLKEIAELLGAVELVALALFLSTVAVYAVLVRIYLIDGCPV